MTVWTTSLHVVFYLYYLCTRLPPMYLGACVLWRSSLSRTSTQLEDKWCVRHIQRDLLGVIDNWILYIRIYIIYSWGETSIVWSTERCLYEGCVLQRTCIADTPGFLILSDFKGGYRISSTRYWQVWLTSEIEIYITWMGPRDMVAYLNATALCISTIEIKHNMA